MPDTGLTPQSLEDCLLKSSYLAECLQTMPMVAFVFEESAEVAVAIAPGSLTVEIVDPDLLAVEFGWLEDSEEPRPRTVQEEASYGAAFSRTLYSILEHFLLLCLSKD